MRKLMVLNNAGHVAGAARQWNHGEYRHIALVLVETDLLPEGATEPRMISERARGVVEIIEEYDGIYVGKTNRSEGRRILNDYEQTMTTHNDVQEANQS